MDVMDRADEKRLDEKFNTIISLIKERPTGPEMKNYVLEALVESTEKHESKCYARQRFRRLEIMFFMALSALIGWDVLSFFHIL